MLSEAARRELRSARRRATRSRGVSFGGAFEDGCGVGGGGDAGVCDVNEGDADWKDGVVEVKRVKVSEAGLRDIVGSCSWCA